MINENFVGKIKKYIYIYYFLVLVLHVCQAKKPLKAN